MFAITNVDGFNIEFNIGKWGTKLDVFVWITKYNYIVYIYKVNDMQHVSCVVLRTRVDVKLVWMTNNHTTKEDLGSQVKKFFWLHFFSHNDKSFVSLNCNPYLGGSLVDLFHPSPIYLSWNYLERWLHTCCEDSRFILWPKPKKS
jgi:hypothetical protein